MCDALGLLLHWVVGFSEISDRGCVFFIFYFFGILLFFPIKQNFSSKAVCLVFFWGSPPGIKLRHAFDVIAIPESFPAGILEAFSL